MLEFKLTDVIDDVLNKIVCKK